MNPFHRIAFDRLAQQHGERPLSAAFLAVNAGLSVGLLTLLAHLSGTPLVFPSLGPTALLLFHSPGSAAASPRNTLVGHVIGIVLGWSALALFGLLDDPSALVGTVDPARAGAAAVALGGTGALMALLRVMHPPAGATTLIVALGLVRRPAELVVLVVGVALLTVQAWGINNLAGRDHPLWHRQLRAGRLG